MNDLWDEVEHFNRDLLLCITSLIPDEDVAGYVFGFGLVISDHVLRPLKWLLR